MASTVGERVTAALGLLLVVLAGVSLVGGGIAVLVALTVDDTPAAEQAATERSDVELVRCGADRQHLTAGVRATNRSSEASDYFVDVAFVRGPAAETVETVTVVIEDVAPGESRRGAAVGTGPPQPEVDCRVGDVDRLAR